MHSFIAAMTDLPPLKSLIAFDAVARLGGFTHAAIALHLTHGAISRQVAQLEDNLGQRLFVRQARGTVLTEAGRSFHHTVAHALASLEHAAQALRSTPRAVSVRISATPAFGARWLLPRLPAFRAAHPGIAVLVDAAVPLVDLNDGSCDFAVRYGRGRWRGVHARLLLRETLSPICTPALARQIGRSVRRLRTQPLLHDAIADGWALWMKAAGQPPVAPTDDDVTFNDYNLVLEAALAGMGVALGRSALVATHLASGQLVAPFARHVAAPSAYYLARAPQPLRPAAQTLWDWLAREVTTPGTLTPHATP